MKAFDAAPNFFPTHRRTAVRSCSLEVPAPPPLLAASWNPRRNSHFVVTYRWGIPSEAHIQSSSVDPAPTRTPIGEIAMRMGAVLMRCLYKQQVRSGGHHLLNLVERDRGRDSAS